MATICVDICHPAIEVCHKCLEDCEECERAFCSRKIELEIEESPTD